MKFFYFIKKGNFFAKLLEHLFYMVCKEGEIWTILQIIQNL